MNLLPNFYLITPEFNPNDPNYLSAFEASLKAGIRFIQLRSKNLPFQQYIALAQILLPLVRRYQAKMILNAPPEILSSVDADGIHLSSARYQHLTQRPIDHHHLLSVACHNREQIDHAEQIEADLALLSPIFATPSSPNGRPIGWQTLQQLTQNSALPIYALGGLTTDDYHQARQSGAYGIGAIRGLWNLSTPLPSPQQ